MCNLACWQKDIGKGLQKNITPFMVTEVSTLNLWSRGGPIKYWIYPFPISPNQKLGSYVKRMTLYSGQTQDPFSVSGISYAMIKEVQ